MILLSAVNEELFKVLTMCYCLCLVRFCAVMLNLDNEKRIRHWFLPALCTKINFVEKLTYQAHDEAK